MAEALSHVRENRSPEEVKAFVLQLRVYSISKVIPQSDGIAHVILAVEDDGEPSLTSYRRVILNIEQ